MTQRRVRANSRRPMEWYSTVTGFAVLAAGAQSNTLLYNAVGQGTRNIKGATITRVIVDLLVKNDTVAQNNELFWGIVIVNADARAAGAFPDPNDMSDRAGWMYRGRILTNASSLTDRAQWAQKQLDLRSQRLLRTEEDELHIIWNNTGATILQFAIFARVLVKLP